MKIFLTPYYSSSWDVPILLYESLKIWRNNEKALKNEIWGFEAQKINFFKKFEFFIFLSSDVQSLSQFSTSIKSIDLLTLPDEIYFSLSSIRKWIQIKIWMYEPRFIFNFKSLASSICRRPQKWRFLWHRITLRVGMGPSCSTSHVKHLVDLKINSKTENKGFGARKLTFTRFFEMIIFFSSDLRASNQF